MEDLTPKQRKIAEKIESLLEKGNLAIVEYLLEIEDKFEETVKEIKDTSPDLNKILESIKGKDAEDGKDYVITDDDKMEIAEAVVGLVDENSIAEKVKSQIPLKNISDKIQASIKIPVVEKVIEKTEVIRETPIVTENVVQVAVKDTPEETRDKLETLKGDERLDKSAIKGLEDIDDFKKNVVKDLNLMSRRPLSSGNIEVYQDGTKIGSSQRLRFSGATVTNDSDGAVKVSITGGSGSFATSAETTAGVATDLAVTPAGFAQSDYGIRFISLYVSDPNGLALSTGDGKAFSMIVPEMNGWNLVRVYGYVSTVSSSGSITVQIHNVTDGVDVLSSLLTIPVSTKTSNTATVNTSNDGVASYDELRVDVDSAGTNAKGLIVYLGFQLAP